MPNDQPVALRFDAYRTPLSAWVTFKSSLATKHHRLSIWLGSFVTLVFGICSVMVIDFSRGTSNQTQTLLTFCILFIGFPAAGLGRALYKNYKKTERALRLGQFAQDNHFGFQAKASAIGYSGTIFSLGSSQSYESVINGTSQGLPFEFGNFCYITGGKNKTERWYGVVRLTLTRRLPNILLDGKSNNRMHISNLPNFKHTQRLQLEGDFNKYFDLYVPKGYERDALYFITPELMQLLIDYGANFDIELVDNYLFIYNNRPFALEREATIRAIFNLMATIGSEVEENTQRYADANIGNRQANLIADPGRRLKKALPWVTIIIIVLWVVITLL